jgi:hypothetical protein
MCFAIANRLSSKSNSLAACNLHATSDLTLGGLDAFVGLDGDLEGSAEHVSLRLQVGAARLNPVDKTESNCLSNVRSRTSSRLNTSCSRAGSTDINDVLNLAENSSNRRANDGNGVEEAGLADEDVEKNLVDADKLLHIMLAMIVDSASAAFIPRGKPRRWRRCQLQREHQPCSASE